MKFNLFLHKKVVFRIITFIFILILFTFTGSDKNILIKKTKIKKMDTATFGTGCFWCSEAIYLSLKGVISVASGYSGGNTVNPTYEEVCKGTTGHAEVVQIIFDDTQISFAKLLEVFFQVHDPTSLNKQGEDTGTQYRSAIFWHNETQKNTVSEVIKKLNESGAYDKPIVTEVKQYDKFYKAENYHLNYFAKNPDQHYCSIVVRPKVEKFKKVFKDILK